MAQVQFPITIPALADNVIWVAWRNELRKGVMVKVPYNPRTGAYAKSDDPSTWGTYAEAQWWMVDNGGDGPGLVLGPLGDKVLCGIDLDTCLGLDSGLEPFAQMVVDKFATYTEISPSGTGVKLFFWVDAVHLAALEALLGHSGRQFKINNGASHPPGIEIYRGSRYFTVTQRIYNAIQELRQVGLADIEWLVLEHGPKFLGQQGHGGGSGSKSRDDSRSGDAFREGGKLKTFGLTYEEMRDRLLDHKDPGISSWALEKGMANGEREMHRIYDRVQSPTPFDPEADKEITDEWLKALARLRAASPHPTFVSGGVLDLPGGSQAFDPSYSGPVALRPGISDRLTRGFVSSVSSAANAGKSTYLGGEAIAIVCERPDILGLKELDWCGDVLIVSNEEGSSTLTSRSRGLMKEWGLTASDFKHKLRFWPTRTKLRIGRGTKDKNVVPTPEGVRFVNQLARWAEAGFPIVMIGLDTLISIFEAVDENSAEMDKAIGLLIAVADAGFIAIDVMQHQGKSGESENIHSYRGSSAIFAALAEMSTLVALTAKEGAEYNLDAVQSKHTLRLMGQRQRDGQVPGVYYFKREIVHLAAEDPRAPGVVASKTVAILKPIAPPAKPTASKDAAWRVLWAHQQCGGLIVRGAAKGGQATADWAHSILGRSLKWERAQAEAILVELENEGAIESRHQYDEAGKHKRLVVKVVKEPQIEPEDPF